jgi:hypothetical protein
MEQSRSCKSYGLSDAEEIPLLLWSRKVHNSAYTEQIGLSSNTWDLYSGGSPFESRPGRQVSWQMFCGFSLSFQANPEVVS